jgi:hypothetical protein
MPFGNGSRRASQMFSVSSQIRTVFADVVFKGASVFLVDNNIERRLELVFNLEHIDRRLPGD